MDEACVFHTKMLQNEVLITHLSLLDSPFSLIRCLQNYIPPQSLTLSCPVCRQTSILPEQGVSALQNNFFISSLMEAMQQAPDGAHDPEDPHPLSAVAGRPLSCPNHEGKVGPSEAQ